jgi:uncharacterized protein
MTMKETLTVKCPTCKHTVAWTDAEPFKPFCSERCKMIDLGDWATEAHKIPGEPVDEDSETDDFY